MGTSVAQSFREAGSSETTARLEEYLTAATIIEKVLAGKEARARFLAGQGRSVLDVGCGSGDALALLAAAGCQRIVGTDLNGELLTVARDRLAGDPRIELVEADAADLPFADGEFESALVERMLQHVEDPAAVVGETVRVVGAGGTVLLVEPDWSTVGISSGDPAITAVVLAGVRDQIRHPGVGRQLRRLLVDAGATEVVVDAEVHETSDLEIARFFALLDEAVAAVRAAGLVPADDLAAWLDELSADAASGRFSASLVLFVARGRVG